MNTKYTILAVGLAIILGGCAAPRYAGNSSDVASIDKESDSQLGMRYLLGRGVPKDNERAFHYFLAAAKDNDAFAQNEVAYLYAVGKGTEQDYEKAFTYYQKAANHGLASAQYSLGLFYAHGLGVTANQEQAEHWFKLSSEHGFEPAKRALAKWKKNDTSAT